MESGSPRELILLCAVNLTEAGRRMEIVRRNVRAGVGALARRASRQRSRQGEIESHADKLARSSAQRGVIREPTPADLPT